MNIDWSKYGLESGNEMRVTAMISAAGCSPMVSVEEASSLLTLVVDDSRTGLGSSGARVLASMLLAAADIAEGKA